MAMQRHLLERPDEIPASHGPGELATLRKDIEKTLISCLCRRSTSRWSADQGCCTTMAMTTANGTSWASWRT